FTIEEFSLVRENLPDIRLELIFGQIVVKPEQGRDYFTIPEFEVVAALFPDHRLELINGDIVMSPQPDRRHQKNTGRSINLFAKYLEQIEALGCEIGGSNYFFSVPDDVCERLYAIGLESPSDVCPDSSICYRDYLDTDRMPPAMLVVEVLSDSKPAYIQYDLTTKPEIYAALEIPSYWVVDRRDNSVWVHTLPCDGRYTLRQQFRGNAILPAPGLEFLQITPTQIFS
ncbi:MAG: Uma2 family endonuclease, partial [Blastocatellia bacterium]